MGNIKKIATSANLSKRVMDERSTETVINKLD